MSKVVGLLSAVLVVATCFSCTNAQTNAQTNTLNATTVGKLIENSKPFQKDRPKILDLELFRKSTPRTAHSDDPNASTCEGVRTASRFLPVTRVQTDIQALEKLGWAHLEPFIDRSSRGFDGYGWVYCQVVLTDAGKQIARDANWKEWPDTADPSTSGTSWTIEMGSAEIMKVLDVQADKFSASALFSWRYRPTNFATKYREQFGYTLHARDAENWDDLMLERRAIAALQKSETGWEVLRIEWQWRN